MAADGTRYYLPEELAGHNSGGHVSKRSVLLIAILVIVGGAMRWIACYSDFWLDEIWSYFRCKELSSSLGVFTEFRSSNNHHLYSLMMLALGDRHHWIGYRIPSMIVGTLTIVLVYAAARRRGELAASLSAVMTATSYLMIHFSSEARGYALVVFFAVASYICVQRYSQRHEWSSALLFGLCTCFGFLSHTQYVFVWLALLAWQLARVMKPSADHTWTIVHFLKCFGFPVIAFVCFYFLVVVKMEIGGGPPYTLSDILVRTLSYAGGGPASGTWAIVVAIIMSILILASLIHTAKTRSSEWIFFLVVIVVAPAVVLLVNRPEVLFVRYFLISIVFAYIAIGSLLAHLARRLKNGRIAVSIVLMLFIIGNSLNIRRLFHDGRGGYREAVLHMERETPGDVITVSSDHQFRNGMILEYYARFLTTGKKLSYLDGSTTESPAAEWILLHRIGEAGDFKDAIHDQAGRTYRAEKRFPYSDMSGWHWFLYRAMKP